MTPEWPLPPGLRAFCSERAGGVSAPPYDTLNLGDHVGDDPDAVAQNRRRLALEIAARPVFLKQVHGRGVVRLSESTADATEADACWTTERGLACTMMVADCLPVLLASHDGQVLGAAHCGWRGLAGEGGQGVLESLWQAMRGEAGGPQQMLAWLGPCIGPEAFEVGPEVRSAFTAHDARASSLFQPHGEGKFLADLQGLARRRLAVMGITTIHGNDGQRAWCTVANPSRFFSHRRDRVSGRFAAGIWRT
jgi:YfiH family protein